MEENTITKEETVEKKGKEAAKEFITEVQDIKNTMVPKSEYEQLKIERDKLKHALLTGINEVDSEQLKTVSELRTEYAEAIKSGVTNVKGFETALKLRNAVLNETGKDPFMTEALNRIDPTFGERVAEGLETMLEKSEGKSEMFNALLSQNIK